MKFSKSTLILAIMLLYQLPAISGWGNMKNKKGQVTLTKDTIQSIKERNALKSQQQQAIQAAQLANDSKNIIPGMAVINPLDGSQGTGVINNGVCYTICEGNKISHPCGITPMCQSKNVFIRGCMNSQAKNYNPNAKSDDGSCILNQVGILANGGGVVVTPGCKNPDALNFNPNANIHEEGFCRFAQATCSSECNGKVVRHACGQTPFCPANTQYDPGSPKNIIIKNSNSQQFIKPMQDTPAYAPVQSLPRLPAKFQASPGAIQAGDF